MLGKEDGKQAGKPGLATTGFAGVHLPTQHAGSLKHRHEDAPRFAALNSWKAQLLSGALEIRKHWTSPALPALEFQGLGPDALATSHLALQGEQRKLELWKFHSRKS